jgi:hypothetical protein
MTRWARWQLSKNSGDQVPTGTKHRDHRAIVVIVLKAVIVVLKDVVTRDSEG